MDAARAIHLCQTEPDAAHPEKTLVILKTGANSKPLVGRRTTTYLPTSRTPQLIDHEQGSGVFGRRLTNFVFVYQALINSRVSWDK